MTKENRERGYKHLRDLEHNYVALPGRDHDLEKTDVLKGRAKISADEMLKKHPELSQLDEDKSEPEVKPKEEEHGKKRKR
ncbi:hypothetical protein LCGC14_2393100 [marine sediment metagenome]|uniref:Uncharacterized protein n=1 Tax=marine sediment metagenome TaxID=412755 RepID=A0A0F9BXP1_9ZZZZ